MMGGRIVGWMKNGMMRIGMRKKIGAAGMKTTALVGVGLILQKSKDLQPAAPQRRRIGAQKAKGAPIVAADGTV